MDNKVTSIPVNTRQWQKAMEACNRADKMVCLINKKMAREELRKLMAKMVRNE